MKKWNEIKGKIDKKAAMATVGLLLMSWVAFPIIYYMIVKAKKEVKIK